MTEVFMPPNCPSQDALGQAMGRPGEADQSNTTCSLGLARGRGGSSSSSSSSMVTGCLEEKQQLPGLLE